MYQGHLFIGQVVHSYDEARAVLVARGCDTTNIADEDLSSLVGVPMEVTYQDRQITVFCEFHIEAEADEDFPVEMTEPYSDALVGFGLTSRYEGSVLDADLPAGRHEPFVVDIAGVAILLAQVRLRYNWPEAQVLLWTLSY